MIAGCVVLLSLLHVTSQDRFFYLRSLPNATFHGAPSKWHDIIEADSAFHCAEQWKDNFPQGFTYDPDTRHCTPYDQIHGIKNSTSVKGHFIQVQTQEGCQGDPHVLLPKLLTCREGWFRIDVDTPTRSSYCYAKIHPRAFKGMPESEIVNLCKEWYPFSHAASIHGQEEEGKIAAQYSAADSYVWYGVWIGLVLDNPQTWANDSTWRWVDGSPMDYKNLNHDKEFTLKTNGNSATGMMYWNRATNRIKWTFPVWEDTYLLCKYTLE